MATVQENEYFDPTPSFVKAVLLDGEIANEEMKESKDSGFYPSSDT